MKKSACKLFAVLLLTGCAEPARETKVENDSPTVANSLNSMETPSAQTATADPLATASTINAAKLLASTLEDAKAENKRVLVHLGAPW